MTLEGAPHLKEEHMTVFDCANPAGKKGTRMLSVDSHIHMMAARSRLSLARSPKRSTCQTTATIEDVKEPMSCRGRWASRRMRCTAMGPNCRNRWLALVDDDDEAPMTERGSAQKGGQFWPRRVVEKIIIRASRSRTRRCQNAAKATPRKAIVGGHKVYLRTGEYQDGQIGEIFHRHAQGRRGFRAMMNNFAIAVSSGLQYGVPLEEFVDAFTFTRFEPAAWCKATTAIKKATSILDYIFRELAVSTLDRNDLAHVQPEGTSFDELGRGDEEGKRNFTEVPGAEGESQIDVLKKVVSTGYLRGRAPQGLVVLQGGQAGAVALDGAADPVTALQALVPEAG